MNSLISVSNRKNLPKLFEFLSNKAHNIYATSGTYKALELYNKKDNLIDLKTKIGYSNLFGGRVKSFHPFVYGGFFLGCTNFMSKRPAYCISQEFNSTWTQLVKVQYFS